MVNELRTVAASPVTSPSTGTTVAVSGTFMINGTPVVVNSGDIGQLKKGISFSLTSPVVLGSIDDFIDWLHAQLGLPIDSQTITDDINKIPSTPKVLANIKSALLQFLAANITLTSLTIDTIRSYYAFGVTMDFNPGIPILGLLTFNGLGLQISHTSAPSSP